jgi:dTDP-glucose 4,6-dehydratase
LEFAKEIIELTNSQSKIIFEELPIDDPQVRQPDVTKAKNYLDWNPKVDRMEGLLKTIDYFRKSLD